MPYRTITCHYRKQAGPWQRRLLPEWEQNIPTPGIKCSHTGTIAVPVWGWHGSWLDHLLGEHPNRYESEKDGENGFLHISYFDIFKPSLADGVLPL